MGPLGPWGPPDLADLWTLRTHGTYWTYGPMDLLDLWTYRTLYFTLAFVSPAIADNVACAALRPSRKSLSENVEYTSIG